MGRRRKEKKVINPFKKMRKETAQAVYTVILFVLGVFLILASIGKAGVAGRTTYNALFSILGVGYFVLPILSFTLGASLLKNDGEDEYEKSSMGVTKGLGSFLFLISSLGIIDLLLKKGGVVGNFISGVFVKFFDFYGGLSIMIALFAISLLIIFEAKLSKESFLFWRKFKKDDEYDEGDEYNEDVYMEDEENYEEVEKENHNEEREPTINNFSDRIAKVGSMMFASRISQKDYNPPPLSLLQGDRGRPGVGDIKANANIIKRTLKNFGMDVEMDEISIGPSVTRYALKPAEGIKLSRIVALKQDLSLALAAHPLRIEAPIPGRSLVGVEIPNSSRTTVGLGSLLSSKEYQESVKPLMISLGRGVSGKSEFANLAKIPHLLIAGATGAGKSVTIHTIINSLVFRNSPENLRFIMIDPKRVELTAYNGIPHLLSPVLTNPKKAILALKWAAKEMERRYDILETERVRDIGSYHDNVLNPYLDRKIQKEGEENEPERMPYILIVIDELADIMSTYPRELEAAVVRLAQMSRAVGIHLVLSTQRPSVQVITGLIKANIPGRIALQVSSQVDSRTILDQSGAESLLGAGDMLYISGEMSKPRRIQSAFISEEEVKKVSKYLKKNYEEKLPEGFDITSEENNGSIDFDSVSASSGFSDKDDDNLYEDARAAVMDAGKASTSYIQRKLRVGYARAARLMDMLEERGVIGPQDGSKPREILEANENSGYGESDYEENENI
ncbi:MAG TPA: DNA translocase FtsK 4TM domain-containing protein [Candidatus Paceibacterota bacterium]|jgi:S-DNA-T family DNA segregation ATPase FtsK/SpoIIIE|nr:cell division protein FtsK [Parcubacteria group bacterium]MDP6119581.1 DNA translocase FtsK 4TM domain-containing protein [Candidatus Paceibacterota bacterium]HJN62826.1 DNA translocase FtsK 4TM domain-containing protein [Candidatus Paceibacterota bacterium]|tara:strand:+ start:15479 stop:17677 length:2199 start_codon:yes stop_codon:yes gene_type:complete